jgi:twitching motility two-component system response regulator PilH
MTIKNILIVDDSRAEQIYLSEMLAAEGFLYRVASSAEDAQIAIDAQRPDLILMDVVMPGQSGFQYTRNLSKNPAYSEIPIMLCTSKDQPTDKMWGLRQGARDYIVKPVQKADLLAKIAALSQEISST